jgi:hypothetical protein
MFVSIMNYQKTSSSRDSLEIDMIRKAIIFLMAIVFSFGTTVSYSNPYMGGEYQTLGIAVNSCGTYVSDFNNAQRKVLYGTWITGYITGINYSNSDISDISGGLDTEALLKWIYNYCEQYPLKKVSNGAHYLVQELYESGAYTRSSNAGN